MLRQGTSILLLLFVWSTSHAQTGLSNELSEVQIEKFKRELTYNYQLFFESVLNIVDDQLDIKLRYNSRSLLLDLFSGTNATVTDQLDLDVPKSYRINEYTLRLFELENTQPILYRRYKFSDTIRVNTGPKGIKTKYLKLSQQERNKKMFQTYNGKVFFVEEAINSTLKSDVDFTVEETRVLKKIDFRIIHDYNDQYTVEIEAIRIIDPNNKAYAYEELTKEVVSSSKDWSDTAEQDYLDQITSKAKAEGIFIKVPEEQPVDSLPEEYTTLDTFDFKYDKLKFTDYLVPGLGHSKLGSDRGKIILPALYSITTISGIAAGIYYDQRSRNQRSDASILVNQWEIDQQIRRADRNSLRSKVAFGIGALSYITHIIHLKKKDNSKKALLKKAKYNDFGLNQIDFDVTPTGLSITMTF